MEITMYNLSPELKARASRIKLLILDVDGVLTDGRIYIRDTGEEIKSFHTLDGHGLKMLQQSGVQTAIITGRDAPSVAIRVQQLGINYYFKGIHDKRATYAQLREQAGVDKDECAFVGDDVVDLPVMVHCGLAVAVPQAHWFTLQHADYVTQKEGGKGAVREVCDLIMHAQNTLDPALNEYIK